MPNLIVFECVDTSRVNLDRGEDSVQVQWSETPPQLDQLVAMGGLEKRWKVVDLIAYHPVGLDRAVEQVYLAIVSREDLALPPQEQWYCHSHPPEAMHVFLSELYRPELSLIWDCQNAPPNVGEMLLEGEDTGIPSSDCSNWVKPSPATWVVDRFDTCLPDGKAPYAMYLCWCSRVKELVAA